MQWPFSLSLSNFYNSFSIGPRVEDIHDPCVDGKRVPSPCVFLSFSARGSLRRANLTLTPPAYRNRRTATNDNDNDWNNLFPPQCKRSYNIQHLSSHTAWTCFVFVNLFLMLVPFSALWPYNSNTFWYLTAHANISSNPTLTCSVSSMSSLRFRVPFKMSPRSINQM